MVMLVALAIPSLTANSLVSRAVFYQLKSWRIIPVGLEFKYVQ